MSKRPIEEKKRRRVAKRLRRTPLTAYFDAVQWLIDHGHARTRKAARELILDERLKVDSHVVGIGTDLVPVQSSMTIEEVKVVRPHLPVEQRERLIVSGA